MQKLSLLSLIIALSLLPSFAKNVKVTPNVDKAGWVISTDDFTVSPYYGAVVANGGIGLLPWKRPFTVKDVILNHVFDSKKAHGISSVMKGLNPFAMTMDINGLRVDSVGVSGWRQSVDMRRGVHSSSFTFNKEAVVSYNIRALRNMPYSGLMTVTVKALKDVEIAVYDSVAVPSGYGKVSKATPQFKSDGKKLFMIRKSAPTKNRGVEVSSSATFLFPDMQPVSFDVQKEGMGFTVKLKKGETFSFELLGSVCSSRDFIDPYNESDRQVSYMANEGIDRVIARHEKLWDDLWQGDVIIEGDDDAQRAVRFSLYNLYSSARSGSGLSIPPFGLSSTGYNGHVFWDTELWMYPPMLFLNQGIARSMMDYRTDRLSGARQRALTYGYDGAMFPWESDDAGEESCPVWALTGAFEHHITADVAIAAWNYYLMTRDLKWLEEKGYPMIKDVAKFWVSRVDRNDDGSYSVNNVVGADEYAINVNDNAFTNGAVVAALRAADKAARACGETPDAAWLEIAENIRIPKSKEGVTLEYDGYEGQQIKQADVNLLGYPLAVITDAGQLRKDLEYYEKKINPKGPAMSFAVLAIQHARLGEGDKAYDLFVRSYSPNQLPPFAVVSEGAGGTNPYFTTGAGGFLQAVINGFCGLELTEEGIKQLPSALPAHWKSVTVKGVGPSRLTFTRTH